MGDDVILIRHVRLAVKLADGKLKVALAAGVQGRGLIRSKEIFLIIASFPFPPKPLTSIFSVSAKTINNL